VYFLCDLILLFSFFQLAMYNRHYSALLYSIQIQFRYKSISIYLPKRYNMTTIFDHSLFAQNNMINSYEVIIISIVIWPVNLINYNSLTVTYHNIMKNTCCGRCAVCTSLLEVKYHSTLTYDCIILYLNTISSYDLIEYIVLTQKKTENP